MVFMDDVIVTGGGPVGLLLAAELRLAGLSVTVLERLTEPSPVEKASSINGRSAQVLIRRGLGPRLAELSADAGAADRMGGWFAGFVVWPDPEIELPPAVAITQPVLERLLLEHAVELGVPVLRGGEVVALDQDAEGVTVRLATGETRRARYLAGCDGARSTVRKLAGFDFPGTDPISTIRKAKGVVLDHPERLTPGWNFTDTGIYEFSPESGKCITTEFDGGPSDRRAEVGPAEVEASLRQVSGADVRVVEMGFAGRFSDTTRQAGTYRNGQVLLAGDAAHVNPPFGGQGLNLGLQDAANLGWKLAAAVHGWAPEGLLDTYTAERHPVAARVLALTRAQGAIMRRDPHSQAVRELFGQLLTEIPATGEHLVASLQSLDIRYDLGAVPGHDDRGAPAGGDGLEVASHPLVGRHVPAIPGLDALLRRPRPVLLDFTGAPDVSSAAADWSDRVDVHIRPAFGDLAALFVRPDGYIAWAADRGPRADPASLRGTLERWCGQPTLRFSRPAITFSGAG
jgi:2-polyprenyl-6-methoxyphenol hydroxylase-like FAD-dependent oxidoreductase